MARVTVEDCVLKIPNRFELVMLAAQRARNVSAGAALTVDRDNDKNPVVALREIAEETVPLHELENSLIKGLQKFVEADEPEEDEMDLLAIQQELGISVADAPGQSAVAGDVGQSAVAEDVGQSAVAEDVGQSAVAEDVGQSAVAEDVGQSAVAEDAGQIAVAEDVGQSAVAEDVGQSAVAEDVGQSAVAEDAGQIAVAEDVGQSAVAEDAAEDEGAAETDEGLPVGTQFEDAAEAENEEL